MQGLANDGLHDIKWLYHWLKVDMRDVNMAHPSPVTIEIIRYIGHNRKSAIWVCFTWGLKKYLAYSQYAEVNNRMSQYEASTFSHGAGAQ